MASFKPFFPRASSVALWAAYAAAAVVFAVLCARFYLPGKGFTYLVMFGEEESVRYLPELKAANHYEHPATHGYDGQYYAQIAMHPQLGDAVVRDAVDGLGYRARRILFCWTAYGLAGGDPVRAMHIYATQNLVCWFALAALLLRWFPATNWENFLRWAGVLFSSGLCSSVTRALVDGPSLLMIAGGVALLEAKRPWWSAALLGVAGLGKETNVLAGAALVPVGEKNRGALGRAALRLGLVVLPLAIWLVSLRLWIGDTGGAGARNFAGPFVFYFAKWKEIAVMHAHDAWHAKLAGLALLALTVQFLFFALRPRWRETWWRVGAAYAALMTVLGEAVWEGYPGAALRVLLPMTLAFNLLVPRGRRWWAVLLLGNLSVALAPETFAPPPNPGYALRGPRALRLGGAEGREVEIAFGENWHGPERVRSDFWRWSGGSATLAMRNPQPFALAAEVSFRVQAHDARTVILRADGRELWRAELKGDQTMAVTLPDVRLAAGETRWTFETDRPATSPGNGDPREMAFALRNLTVTLTRRAE